MSPPSFSELPPYSSTAVPSLASASTASSPFANSSTPPTQRKTVRFKTDSTDEYVRRGGKSGPAAAGSAGHRDHRQSIDGGVMSPGSAGPGSSSSTRFAHFPFGGYGGGIIGGSGGGSSGGSSSSNKNANTNNHHNNDVPSRGPPSYDGGDADPAGSKDDDDDGRVVRPTLLQPRVAVVLGLPTLWHLPLFACRSLSVCPAIWWSLGIFIRLLAQLHALAVARGMLGGLDPNGHGEGAGGFGRGGVAIGGNGMHDRGGLSLESRLKLTETALAMIWCGASAYLSFFFTDCLMTRWLLNYTPQATIVRLLAINALNGYLTSWVIYLMGSGGDSRLLLPAWVAIATILTGLYHATQRKINIRKETSISISVFSGASFFSMAALLAQLYWDRPEYVEVPVVALARRVCTETARVAGNLFDIGNITMDL